MKELTYSRLSDKKRIGFKSKPIKAVILAAGDGDRLKPHSSRIPKSLLPLHGKPIITYLLDNLIKADVEEAIIVIGYKGRQFSKKLGDLWRGKLRLKYIKNQSWNLGNTLSLWAVRELIDGSFVLVMADHFIDPAPISLIVKNDNGYCRLAVEKVSMDDERSVGATRAYVKNGRVIDLGKKIKKWNALDMGLFWCTPDIFREITPEMREGELGSVFVKIAKKGKLYAFDMTGKYWIDIDTFADLKQAEKETVFVS